jgi:hypothetical protein
MGGITMTGTAKAGTAGQRRAVFTAGEDAALATLEQARAEGGYRAFGTGHGTWPAIGGAGEVLTGATQSELDRKIRAHWQERQ